MRPSVENAHDRGDREHPDIARTHASPSGCTETVQEEAPEPQLQKLNVDGTRDAGLWRVVDGKDSRDHLATRWQSLNKLISDISRSLHQRQARGETLPADAILLLENDRLLHTLGSEVSATLKVFRGPAVKGEGAAVFPRAYAVAAGYLEAANLIVSESTLCQYLDGIQQVESLMMAEIWGLKPMLEFTILEQIIFHAGRIDLVQEDGGLRAEDSSGGLSPAHLEKAFQALRSIQEIDWTGIFEQMNAVECTLRRDPAGIYPKMDDATRQMYRKTVEEFARQSLFSEEEVARQTVFLAMRSQRHNLRPMNRRMHVGYYLIGDGNRILKRRLGYKPTLKQRIVGLVLAWPEVYYVVGVEVTTIALVFFLLFHLNIIIPVIPGLLLLIPASHAAIGIVNGLTSRFLPPRRLPKMDYSQGIPEECTTLVAVPCMLLSEAEVRRNVNALEIRYLGNRDPNLHFALLTDSPDASEPFDRHDELIEVCSNLIQQLNHKYGQDKRGSFVHLHRHRVFNPSEGSWMGWERKRGKLMDLNNLLLGIFDSFPVKAGELAVLTQVRYVITLDADTKLPPGTAHGLVGCLDHPLNHAVIDPETNTVVEGYAILQPRVSVSIESSRHSRLASIYSGQTGYDVYTQAISDVYQDLFGEGNFAGKGIYDVETFQRVLGDRFPTNALLSHDLIEGAYARAGLVSDIVVVDDYPSHFSAYVRRLHRWVRGDWQIMRWLLPTVPDYYGKRVPNPLSFISRWKIFDNLRRSINDIGLFLLLIMGWAVLPGGALFWTFVTLGLLLVPTYLQLFFALFNIRRGQNWNGFLRERANELVTGHLQVFVMLVFLPHQALVMIDAILRTLTRLTVTHSNLLEWETMAEAESGKKKKTPVETYLAFTPWISLAIGLTLAAVRPASLLVASPILALWLLEDYFTSWVNRRPVDDKASLSAEHESFLRLAGLRTWRYFREFSTAANHWLIPDNVQVNPPMIASRLSSTNLGILLNSHLAAHEMGFSTLGEYAESVERTLSSAKRLPRHNGHFYNWYDLDTHEPLHPRYVSTVDSGNMAASLWTLKQSCLGLAHEPLFSRNLWQGIRDHIQILSEVSHDPIVADHTRKAVGELAGFIEPLKNDAAAWIGALPWLEQQIQGIEESLAEDAGGSTATESLLAPEAKWWAGETAARLRAIRNQVESLIPWALRQNLPFFNSIAPLEEITLASLPAALQAVKNQVAECLKSPGTGEAEQGAARLLTALLPTVLGNAGRLSHALQRIAEDADQLVDKMDFRFLYNPKKKLFSTGLNVSTGKLDPSHYDLLASEARMAVFVAIAKGDATQEAWLHLGRPLSSYHGERVLLSWSGTMFEYLMPALWMRSQPETIMDEALRAAVHAHQAFAHSKGVPWGISEAAFSERNPEGVYAYRAFGVSELAMDPHASSNLVISPYSSFLALLVEDDAPVRNLKVMNKMGWMGSLGFYDSCDFTPAQKPKNEHYEIVRCWMVHHQGMSLMALANFLNNFSIQKWFHNEPRVLAAQLMLHENAALSIPLSKDIPRRAGLRPKDTGFRQNPATTPSVPDQTVPTSDNGNRMERDYSGATALGTSPEGSSSPIRHEPLPR